MTTTFVMRNHGVETADRTGHLLRLNSCSSSYLSFGLETWAWNDPFVSWQATGSALAVKLAAIDSSGLISLSCAWMMSYQLLNFRAF